jgi:hypothetical protein
MERGKLVGTVKPGQNLFPLQARRPVRLQGPVGRVVSSPKVVDDAVRLGVLVDVGNEPGEVGIGIHQFPAKGALEEGSGAAASPVEGPGVGIEKIGEVLAGLLPVRT